jgi:hypothetical protein
VAEGLARLKAMLRADAARAALLMSWCDGCAR